MYRRSVMPGFLEQTCHFYREILINLESHRLVNRRMLPRARAQGRPRMRSRLSWHPC
jgi:hypothetical protein